MPIRTFLVLGPISIIRLPKPIIIINNSYISIVNGKVGFSVIRHPADQRSRINIPTNEWCPASIFQRFPVETIGNIITIVTVIIQGVIIKFTDPNRV